MKATVKLPRKIRDVFKHKRGSVQYRALYGRAWLRKVIRCRQDGCDMGADRAT